MRTTFGTVPVCLGVFCLLFRAGWMGPVAAASPVAEIKALFANPPREYSSGPLWVWNDRLKEEQIRGTLEELAGQQIKQVFVHPRPGLMTPYLSEEWFRLWNVAMEEAERLDLNLWIYDENSYPSGFAGGFVPEAMPESRGRGLLLREVAEVPAPSAAVLAVYARRGERFENLIEAYRRGQPLGKGKYWVASLSRAKNSPWHGGRCYVDLLYPGVTELFLEITLDAYQRTLGQHFGERIPGVFTDEPHLRPAGGWPWTDHLPAAFQARWGYDLMEALPALALEVGDWKRVRHHYMQVLLDQFIERWARPYSQYCATNRLEWTGHYWEHEWPRCLMAPDNMAMYAWHQRPAIDTLMNQYREDTHAQFGNIRAVRELSSVANQLGLKRTLCEAYGAGGWDLRFSDMKRIGDWLFVLGVNTLNQHLSYITIRGARKRDHPLSFSYHEPWWEAYHESAQYFARLSLVLSQGRQINPVLVLEPTTTAWLYQSEAQNHPRLADVGRTFQQLLVDLDAAQVEYDLGCEDILARNGSSIAANLVVGQRAYQWVVLPPLTENLNRKTIELLETFGRAGGKILSTQNPPPRMDGALSDRPSRLAALPGWQHVAATNLVTRLQAEQAAGPFAVERSPENPGLLFHHRRQLADGDFLLLVNTSEASSAAGSVRSPARSAQQWDPHSGRVEPYPFHRGEAGIRTEFHLPPTGSLLLWLSNLPATPPEVLPTRTNHIQAAAPPEMRWVGPNVLVMDYVDLTAGGKTHTNLYFYQAAQRAFQENGLARNPWDSAVQFRDEWMGKAFPADSGFTAAYRFVLKGVVPKPLSIVIERPDLYTITCNGQPVAAKPGDWWLDRAFGRIDLTAAVREGENRVEVKASPFTLDHELEPAYLLGAFALEPQEHGFAVVAEDPLELGPWNDQGYPFYADGVLYRQIFELESPQGKYHVTLPDWYGSVAKVVVNGKEAGWIGHAPWRCEVTPWVHSGTNTVELTVIGTLKNTLGPHHGNPGLGAAWPAMFQKGADNGPPPGRQYHTVGYGLFAPFLLEQVCEVPVP